MTHDEVKQFCAVLRETAPSIGWDVFKSVLTGILIGFALLVAMRIIFGGPLIVDHTLKFME